MAVLSIHRARGSLNHRQVGIVWLHVFPYLNRKISFSWQRLLSVSGFELCGKIPVTFGHHFGLNKQITYVRTRAITSHFEQMSVLCRSK